jgi:NadR type nicotinamide-nucleotide adenylyltransferase
MVQRICITGPEATGKSSLAKSLADRWKSSWVPEFARQYLNTLGRPYEEHDLEKILLGQMALEEKIASAGHHIIFCDTGPEVVWVWSRFKYGKVSPLIDHLAREAKYDLTLLLDTDLPWAPDPLRENPSAKDRAALLKLFKQFLKETSRSFQLVSGQGESRVNCAKKNLRRCMKI